MNLKLLVLIHFFSKIICGALERIGGNENLQIACVEEIKNMIMQKYQNKIIEIPRLDSLKLKNEIAKPLELKNLNKDYHQILAEIDNEYNDLLLS